MAKKIHYHSDCAFFAGCENMLVNFLSSPKLRRQFEVSFSYRDSNLYTAGLNQRVQVNFPIFPMRFPDFSDPAIFPGPWPLLAKRIVLLCMRLALTWYEVWALRGLFLHVRPDIVHINCGVYPAALSAHAAVIAARLAGVPSIVMVVNNQAADYSRLSRWLSYPMDRLIARLVSKFVAGSMSAATQLKKVLRLNQVKCQALHNGIELRNITETREETRKRLGLDQFNGVVFGVVAILRPNKGHQVLLDAMVKLVAGAANNIAPPVRILIEGDGPLRVELQEFVVANRLSEHCIFVGEEKNVMNFMALLDVLILPSVDEEDFPNVILEAMGLGKPVIASCLAGTPEQIVDGETGLLLTPRDACQLAAAITRLSLDEQLRLRMGQVGLRRFQKFFTAEVAVRNYISLYQSLIEGQNK